jgi:hypothetical protein
MTIDGALDGASFLAYVEQIVAPTLPARVACRLMAASFIHRWREAMAMRN